MPVQHYRQGDLDGLCGIYALLNALFQSIYGRRSLAYKHADDHFVDALSYIPKNKLHEVIISGLTTEELFKIAKKFCGNLILDDVYTIAVSQPYQDKVFASITDIRKELAKQITTFHCGFIVAINYHRKGRRTGGHWLALRRCDSGGFYVINNDPSRNYIPGNSLRVHPGFTQEFEYKSIIRLDLQK